MKQSVGYSMSCRVVLKRMFSKLIWSILSVRVPKTNKIKKDIRVFQSIDENLSKAGVRYIIYVYRKLKSYILLRFRIVIISDEI